MTENVTPLFPGRERRPSASDAQDQVILEGAGEPSDRLPIRITRLEMRRPPTKAVSMPLGPRLGLLRLREVPTPFYRFMFDGVGREHHWRLPEGQTDDELHEWLNSAGCEVHVLYVGGAPAGFFELDIRERHKHVEILCFGLMPYGRGRGLSRWFLAEAIRAAWAHEPPRLRIQTNNHDSPIALRLYQSQGFEVSGSSSGFLILKGDE